MSLDKLSLQRFWIFLLIAVAIVGAVFWWYIPELKMANQKAPDGSEIYFHSQCVSEVAPPPYYGNREPVNYCTNG